MIARTRAALVAALLTAGAVLLAPAAAGAAGHTPDELGQGLASARAATAAYHDAGTAMEDGYRIVSENPVLANCIAIPGGPGMGVHLIDGELMDATIDVAAPEALVYEPTARGSLRLVALEYLVPQAAWEAEHGATVPRMFGMPMHLTVLPGVDPFYAMHAWIWKHNPSGTFADFNPDVSCDAWD